MREGTSLNLFKQFRTSLLNSSRIMVIRGGPKGPGKGTNRILPESGKDLKFRQWIRGICLVDLLYGTSSLKLFRNSFSRGVDLDGSVKMFTYVVLAGSFNLQINHRIYKLFVQKTHKYGVGTYQIL